MRPYGLSNIGLFYCWRLFKSKACDIGNGRIILGFVQPVSNIFLETVGSYTWHVKLIRLVDYNRVRVLNFDLEGTQQFSSCRGHFHWKIDIKYVCLLLESCRGHHSKNTGDHGSCCG